MLTQPFGCFLLAPVDEIIDRGARHHRVVAARHRLVHREAPEAISVCVSQVAARGSKRACYILGLAYAKGPWGFPKDETMARRYYSMVASAAIDDLTDGGKEIAAKWLREHPAA